MLDREKTRLVDTLSKELSEGNLAIFAGAGFSRGAGYVDWKNLLKPIADDLDLDIDKEWDLVTLAQYHSNANHSNRAKLNQLLVTEFCRNLTPTKNHEILSRLPISTFWTTNYDKLLEVALEKNGKVPDVKYTNKQLAITVRNRDAIVYKMHGDSDHASDAILTRDDYEKYHLKMQPFITALSGDLVSKTFLFVGFSFTDPNLEYILSRVRISYGNDQRQHYCILRRASRNEKEEQADFEYRQRKEQLFSGELLRVGIKVTYVDNFTEITEILCELENRYKMRTIFISGAAHEYHPWQQKEAESFIYRLSREISKRKYRVVSGFGLGVGSAVITGVLEQTILDGGRLNEEQLVLRPFPQSVSGTRTLPELWSEYRKNMISHAGIALFIFGNELINGEIVNSSGMEEEFRIARENGVFVIPIGITGYVTEILWGRVVDEFDESGYKNGKEILRLLKFLGDKQTQLEDASKKVLEILNLL
ncbi:SIR2 family protein [Janthinobacterium tructae]